jgi:energy-converting hydrogenase Eha subunit G
VIARSMLSESGGKREIFWAIWFIGFGLFFISGALVLEQLIEKVLVATCGVIFVGLGPLTLRDREVHKWVRDASVVTGSVVSLGIWLA